MKRVTLLVSSGNKRIARRWQPYRRDGLYDWKVEMDLKAGDYQFTMSGDVRAAYQLVNVNLLCKAKLNTVRMAALLNHRPADSFFIPPASPSSR